VGSPACRNAGNDLRMLVITQCSMRHLYAASSEPGVSFLIDKAKTYERRRCGHRPEDYPNPLSEEDCLASVVDPKNNKSNKNCYVVASQEIDVRKHMRGIMGVPLVYIARSVMIMEPMAEATSDNRDREERIKFRVGLKRGSGSLKRKREDDVDGAGEGKQIDGENTQKNKKRSGKGPKEPNPLAVKKSKKSQPAEYGESKKTEAIDGSKLDPAEPSESGGKRKRRRKPKSSSEGTAVEGNETVEVDD
jgi:U3 small nucleolar RNA-associated protein 23